MTFDVEPENSAVANEFVRLHREQQYEQLAEFVKSQVAYDKVIDQKVLTQTMDFGDLNMGGINVVPALHLQPLKREAHKQISCYHTILKAYEPYMLNDAMFQELFIRSSYHMGDVDSLTTLSEVYLHNPCLNEQTLNYILNGFAVNYEPEQAKLFLSEVTNMRKNLNVILLETVLMSLSKYGALFEIIINCVQTWILSRNTLPSARAMAVVLSQGYKYGTVNEVREIEQLIYRYGLNEDFRIREAKLKYQVCNRDKIAFKKQILAEDVDEVNDIIRMLRSSNKVAELTEFYHSMVDFFVRYTTSTTHIEHILKQMSIDGIQTDKDIYRSLMQKYLIHEKFLDLANFLESSNMSKNVPFELEHLQVIFETFVRSYPHYTEEFYYRFLRFVKMSSLSNVDKQSLISVTKIHSLQSQLKPFGLGSKGLNPHKYRSKDWEPMPWILKKGRPVSYPKQVQFRVEKGFGDLLKRGLKPDFHVIEETFRRSSLFFKTRILQLAQDIRMPTKNQNRLSVINLHFATKDELSAFFKYHSQTLNSNNKISFSRLLSNKGLHAEAVAILDSINTNEIPDSSLSVIFVYRIRALFQLRQPQEILQAMEEFPVHDVTISPYLLKQSVQLERKFVNCEDMSECVGRLRGFIGDCKVVLEKDRADLEIRLEQVLQYVDTWIKS
ncbi:hypothetical protein PSN45_004208 [Yamadazyma tenuis]|nr:hypothetical protein PSN45_004208 [Yamadazyma tenuis]